MPEYITDKNGDSKNPRRIIAKAAVRPNIDALHNELLYTLRQTGTVRSRQEACALIRFAEWNGMSDDYRKHAQDLGTDALPFEGASDARIREADKICNERVALQVNALMKGEIQAVPLSMEDAGRAGQITRLLRHVRDVLLRKELRSEATLLANWQESDDPGYAVLKVWWKRKLGLELRQLTTEDVGQIVMQARGIQLPDASQPGSGPGAAQVMEIGDLIFNKEREAEAVAMLGEAFPGAQPRALKKALRELRKTGEAELPVPFVQENRLCFTALRFHEDVFFPIDCYDVGKARVIFEREWLDEAGLRDRAASEGWDPAFVEAVINASPGPSGVETDPYGMLGVSREQDILIGGVRERESLYELFHAYSRAYDEMGIEGVYWTVMSMKVEAKYGHHELLDYPDGEMPFVDFRREYVGRGIHTSRGTPIVVGSDQRTLKTQRDMQVDAAQLMTIPPLKIRAREGGIQAALGPLAQNKVRNPDDITALQLGPGPNASMLVEGQVRKQINEYYARGVNEDQAKEIRQAMLEQLMGNWTDAWCLAWQKGLMLLQTYMDPTAVALVSGGDPVTLTRDEIRGSFSTMLDFSVNDLDLDFVTKRITAISQVLPMDMAGTVDRSYIVRSALRGIDPTLGQFGVRDGAPATAAETRDQVNRIGMMANGIEPPLQTGGVNASLRLQTLQKNVQGSPVLARRYGQPANQDDQLFKTLVDNEAKNLKFLDDQYRVNPAIGRAGTKPVTPAAAA